MYELHTLLNRMVEENASDLHLSAGLPPMLRKDGKLMALGEEKLTPAETQRLAYSVMTEMQKKRFEQTKEVDFSFGIGQLARFRANAFVQRGCVALALRVIPREIKSFQDLGLPKIIEEMCERPNGLVLVCGATGSGKTTTLAAMLDKINNELEGHIITIEDPIEYTHRHKSCLVNQREVGADTDSFSAALRSALRQDPDVVLIGEMRDLETMRAAITLAETGHLTFATLHTNSSIQAIHRIVDSFPEAEKEMVQAQLATMLQGVICQTLLPAANGRGRILCYEVMNCTPAIKNKIRKGQVHEIQSYLEAGQKDGQITFNMCLRDLIRDGRITQQAAETASPDPDGLAKMLM